MTPRRSELQDRARQRPRDAVDGLDRHHDRLGERVEVVRLAPRDHVVRAGDAVDLDDAGDRVDLPRDVTRPADLGLDQDVRADHGNPLGGSSRHRRRDPPHERIRSSARSARRGGELQTTGSTSRSGIETAGSESESHAPAPPASASPDAIAYSVTSPNRSNTKPPTPAPTIGAMPKPTVDTIDCPVEYSVEGSIFPMTTTPVVNRNAKPMPSNTVSNETIVGSSTSPHSRNPNAYTQHPSTYALRRPHPRCAREASRIIGTSTRPPSAVPMPTRSGPPPSLEILSAKKFHAALKPVHTRNTAMRNRQNFGAARKAAPTAPSRPWCSSGVGRSGATVADHARIASDPSP